MEEHSLYTGAVTINYAEVPSAGPPLVMLHRTSYRWQGMATLFPELAPDWHIYAPDLRGHGGSGRAPGRYRLSDYADDVVTFLEESVPEPAVLFGHSMGGIVEIVVAARMPALVRGLIVGDSPLSRESWGASISRDTRTLVEWRRLSGGNRPLEEVVSALKDTPLDVPGRSAPVRLGELLGTDNPWFSWMAESLARQDPEVLTALLDDFEATAEGYEMDVLLPRIKCPVLLIQADSAYGGLMTDAEVERARALLPGVAHVRLKGIGHGLHGERKQPVVEAIEDFLRTLKADLVQQISVGDRSIFKNP